MASNTSNIRKVLLSNERVPFESVVFSQRSQFDRHIIRKDGTTTTLSVKQAEQNASWLMRNLRRAHYDESGRRRAYSLQQVVVFVK